MFVQVITGHVADAAHARLEWEAYERRLTDTDGYLGATAGVADDGTFIAMVRYTAMSTGTVSLEGTVVHNCVHTDIWNKGGSDGAGFVQIRQGRSNDPSRLRDLYVNQQPVRMGPFRPEVLGGLFAWHDDGAGGFTLSAYFTSEREARGGENLHEFKSFFDDIDAVMQDLTYIDLRDPWLSTSSKETANA